MSVDVSAEMQPPPSQNGGTAEVHVNGLSNGHSSSSSKHHKSSSKDKHRDKDKDRDRHKSSSSSGHKSSSRDKEKHSSSSSSGKDKHRDKERDDKHSSSSKSSHRDKDRDKDRSDKDRSDKDRSDKDRSDKDRSEKDRSDKDRSDKDRSDKDRSDKERSDKDRSDKDRSDKDRSDKDRSEKDRSEKDRSDKDRSDKDRSEKDRSEKDRSEKDRSEKDRSDKDRSEKDRSEKDRSEKDRSDRSDKDRSDRDKHKSSSSSSSSSAHKSSSKDKERRDKDKDRSSSSSSKDKDRHHKSSSSSSSSRDKDRERDKDRHHKSSSSSSKHKHSSSSSSSKSSSHHHLKQLETTQDGEFIKPEPLTQSLQNGYDNSEILARDIKLEEIKKEQLRMEEIRKEEIKQEYLTPDPLDNSFNNGGFKENYESQVKLSFQDISQASSCDYSMSQFKDDEPEFVAKEEASYQDDSAFNEDEDVSPQADDDEEDEDMPLATRKSSKHHRQIANELDDEDEDVPLSKRKLTPEIKCEDDEDEDVPLIARKKPKKEAKEKTKEKEKKKKRNKDDGEDDYNDVKPNKKTKRPASASVKTEAVSPTKRMKKEKNDEEDEVWRWWEEEKREDGVKWSSLEHKGPVFAPLYERLPKNVRFFYNGKPMQLSEETEEAATFYAKMLNHDYCSKQVFNDNFFKDFRKSMTKEEKEAIRDFEKCNFEEMNQYFLAESEKRKNASKEEKLRKKEENEAIIKEYGVCIIDGHKEKIGNFRLEPPGLFRGRGEHPKMGMIKRRIRAEDVSINCSKDSKIPQPPHGHRWREVIHNNTVTWLASWTENVQGQVKYIMLNPSSKLKGEKDHVKYETARRLAKSIDSIRNTYRNEWKSKEMRVRQRAVALYFIDKLALRAGNEKDEDQADTVGCCSLRVEHVSLHKQLSGKENVVVFDFLGKDSIRYYNEVEVEKRVFKNLELFMENKKTGDDLFDRLNTQVLNEHLKELMDGLTAKVFRTYNASVTLQNQLDLLTEDDMTIPEKLLAYNRANRAVAILCNHQRSVPKSHEKSMENLKEKIRQKRELIDDGESEYMDLKRAAKRGSVKERLMADKKGKQLERLKEQLQKLELQETDRDENKTIALGTSKLNYLDPRISVAWCKKNGVPIEKIFNKTQRNKFMWAIHMADEKYRF